MSRVEPIGSDRDRDIAPVERVEPIDRRRRDEDDERRRRREALARNRRSEQPPSSGRPDDDGRIHIDVSV